MTAHPSLFRGLLLAVALGFPATLVAQNADSPRVTKDTAATVVKPVADTARKEAKAEPKKEKPIEGLGGPFVYSEAANTEYVPVSNAPLTIPLVIRGIVVPAKGEPIAVIEIPEQNRTYYKKCKEAIRIPPKYQNNKLVSEEVYLMVTAIRGQEVEIEQQKRPDASVVVQ